ncbi:MAG: CRISPR-associated endonuclease Cas2 [Candidatus Liptonbacteria bacterium]|nr:CRISPR-associated endonuclease Cas2 [Candidatus Liptonbacteria bacterium]
MRARLKKNNRLGVIQRKVLLLLLAGISLGLAGSPHAQWKVLKELHQEWEKINRQSLERAIRSLYESKLVTRRRNKDGTLTMELSDAGKRRALTFNLATMKIARPPKWDGQWRIVLFDVPEEGKSIRDAFRAHLKRLGFYELQKSVFVHPFECRDEIDFIIELHDLRPHVRFIVAHSIDNAMHLKNIFNL